MTGTATSDLTRALDAVKRRWWIPAVAALLGLVLGYASTMGGGVSTYQAVVSTPAVRSFDLIGAVSTNASIPVDQLMRTATSPETATRLGDAVKGAAVTATAATDNTSITLRVTAPNAAKARAAAEAFGADLAAQYHSVTDAQLKVAIDALKANIQTLAANPQANNGNLQGELAAERLRLQQMEALAAKPAPTATITELSSGNPSTSAAILLGIAFGALAAALLGVRGLFDSRLRYTDDVERVTGPQTVVASAGSNGWGLGSVVARLSAEGPVTVVPLSGVSDEVKKAVEAAGAKLGPAFTESTGAPQFAGPVLLLASLAKDKRAALDSAYRALSAADGPFAGVVTA